MSTRESPIVQYALENEFTYEDLQAAAWVMRRRSLSFLMESYDVLGFFEDPKNSDVLRKLQNDLNGYEYTLILNDGKGRYFSTGVSSIQEAERYLSLVGDNYMDAIYLVKDRQLVKCSMLVEKKVRLILDK